jgi:twitching motility protein PilT
MSTESGAGESAEPMFMLMRQAVKENASDVHLRADSPPRIRLDGELLRVKGMVPTLDMMRRFFERMLTAEQIESFETTRELDFSHDLPGVCRMRVNLYQERGAFCAAIRIVPRSIPTMEEIGLPPACEALTRLERGLVLVTGPTGSGKSTTLGRDDQSHQRLPAVSHPYRRGPHRIHVRGQARLVTQRELASDTISFGAALRHSFRQDPDVVLLGEMRDLETMATAITLAETGHLTFSTLHTGDAAQTISRIVDAFPPHQQEQVRLQLANSLEAVIAQRLLPRKDRKGRVAAREVMICTRAIRNLIKENKLNQIGSSIQTGVEEGMITMNVSLAELVKSGFVDYEVARTVSPDPKDFAQKFAGRRR